MLDPLKKNLLIPPHSLFFTAKTSLSINSKHYSFIIQPLFSSCRLFLWLKKIIKNDPFSVFQVHIHSRPSTLRRALHLYTLLLCKCLLRHLHTQTHPLHILRWLLHPCIHGYIHVYLLPLQQSSQHVNLTTCAPVCRYTSPDMCFHLRCLASCLRCPLHILVLRCTCPCSHTCLLAQWVRMYPWLTIPWELCTLLAPRWWWMVALILGLASQQAAALVSRWVSS